MSDLPADSLFEEQKMDDGSSLRVFSHEPFASTVARAIIGEKDMEQMRKVGEAASKLNPNKVANVVRMAGVESLDRWAMISFSFGSAVESENGFQVFEAIGGVGSEAFFAIMQARALLEDDAVKELEQQ